ncbi:hypothetical protein MTO96_022609 [Rhipicephalus appendiculatus]
MRPIIIPVTTGPPSPPSTPAMPSQQGLLTCYYYHEGAGLPAASQAPAADIRSMENGVFGQFGMGVWSSGSPFVPRLHAPILG